MLTHLSLFSGIGGLDLAAEWAGIKTVGQCEWADYPTQVLEKHWPDVPRWKDIRTLTGDDFYERTGRRTVDIVSGGFPCQPFSVAGKRRGKEDDRYLWPEMVRVITELRPTWIVGENVAGIVNMALDDVLSDLESEGYATRTFLFPAHAVGAPHRRYRTAIVGYSEHNGLYATTVCGGIGKACQRKHEGVEAPIQPSGTGESRNMPFVANTQSHIERGLPERKESEKPGFICSCENVQYADYTGCKEFYIATEPNKKGFTGRGCDERTVSDADDRSRLMWRDRELSAIEKAGGQRDDNRRRASEYVTGEWWAVEPDVGRVAYGVPHRVDRLRCLGNAVVPQQFYPIFRAIAEIELGV